uniref:B box-type domain-containing protein n=1 Tax=Ananas comosus var. bracteatus TaxID=296719 RepID=A0A6V7P4E2_ANACO|nr:unnamed protein product [Ananas comosus var. bracteatus]
MFVQEIQRKPAWLEALDTQKFFGGCTVHAAARKNEKNICCLDCCTAICAHCAVDPSHRSHRVVQVRRYVYHDVVRLSDLAKLIDCSSIQSYIINNSKVIFIKKRPQNRQFKGSGNFCTSCDRALQEPYIHCSLECKVDYVLTCKKNISIYPRTIDRSKLISSEFVAPYELDRAFDHENNDTPHAAIVEGDEAMGSSDSENLSGAFGNFVHKRRSELKLFPRLASRVSSDDHDMVATNMNRRKGTPHRSPLS